MKTLPTRYYVRFHNKTHLKPAKGKMGFMCFGEHKDLPLNTYESVYLFDKPQDIYRRLYGRDFSLKAWMSRDMTIHQLGLL